MSPRLSWIIGRGGLLGRHSERALLAAADADRSWLTAAPIPWDDEARAEAMLEHEASRFLEAADRSGEPWRLLWCAGRGVVATSEDALARETGQLGRLLAALEPRLTSAPELGARGTIFLASSAGGVYAGGRPPYDEDSPTEPMAPYGRAKLAQERLAKALATSCGVDLIVGRFSNLYGPGQDLRKPHGLIAHAARAALRREPLNIYVPLDTIRDYLYAPDAGAAVARALARSEATRRSRGGPATVTKIFASEVDTTVAAVLATWRQVLGRPLRVAFGWSPASLLQPHVLSFRSRVWPDLRRPPTPLLLGVDTLRRDQLARMQSRGLD